jgi:prolyl-tRNA editing enzyme YbaK/EbsC (Cys-tRNA(Pro) deacylase)
VQERDALHRFLQAAAGAGLRPEVKVFPQGTRTAAEAAAAVGCPVGAIVKSLLFLADGQPVLVLVSGENRVDEGKLARALGAAHVRKARADEVREATGFAVGGVPPLGHIRSLPTLIDPDLLRYETVWCAAGRPDAVFPIEPERLAEATGALPVDLAMQG